MKCRNPRRFNPWEYVQMLPAVLLTPYLMLISGYRLLKPVKDKRLRDLLYAVCDPEVNALSYVYTLSTFAMKGESGYPDGGSIRMAQNIADTVTSLGGEIRYRTPAETIRELPDGSYVVKTATEELSADAVIVTLDARKAIDKLFQEPLQDRWARVMRKKILAEHCMFLGIGLKVNLQSYPRSMQMIFDPRWRPPVAVTTSS